MGSPRARSGGEREKVMEGEGEIDRREREGDHYLIPAPLARRAR